MGAMDKVKDLKNSKGISKAGGVLEEFKKFISKGNVIDLAVGVIVGGAFTAIVNSLVKDILMPVIGMLLAGVNFSSLGFTIPWGNNPYINVGGFIQAIITFLLTAGCVFILVKFLNNINKKKAVAEEKAEGKEPEVPEDVALLTEIRDLLSKQIETNLK